MIAQLSKLFAAGPNGAWLQFFLLALSIGREAVRLLVEQEKTKQAALARAREINQSLREAKKQDDPNALQKTLSEFGISFSVGGVPNDKGR